LVGKNSGLGGLLYFILIPLSYVRSIFYHIKLQA